MVRLWSLGCIKPIPPWFFGKKSALLAMGSLLENCQVCLKMYVSSCCCIELGIGEKLLKKVTLDRSHVFKSVAFPLNEKCLLDIGCTCFSISSKQLFQLNVLVVFKSVVKNTPNILVISLICVFLIYIDSCSSCYFILCEKM